MGNPNQAYFDEIENEAIQTLITGLARLCTIWGKEPGMKIS